MPSSSTSRHALAVDTLHDLLFVAAPERATVRSQNPVVLDRGSEPHPDIGVVRRLWQGYPERTPAPGDIPLLVEVADLTLATDCGAKLELSASRVSIREFWVIAISQLMSCTSIAVHRTASTRQSPGSNRREPSTSRRCRVP
jgi:Uma2 family endonuclease